ncbi:caspase family protein [Bradyrhizobium rifense]|uniref:Caspase family protein n=1 Tax=Bradyrhizobium rifense TaxID=515499 RepID=A0A5D3KAC4_9BRAD|nr:caspase family protein [Bradyrhizobium rifense]TYL92736.1 caspase family protein [Bradyrhizobium rifense]
MKLAIATVLSFFFVQSAAAVPAECRATSGADKIDSTLHAAVTIRNDARTGQPSTLSWQISKSPELRDSFLVVGFPGTTRFGGDGFVALPPTARAPRSIRAYEEKTRLIVPLSSSTPSTTGSAKIIFYNAGATKITWSIVGLPPRGAPPPCVEANFLNGILDVQVTSGPPQFVAQDRFSSGDPKFTFVSNHSKFLLSVFQDRYQVIEKNTGDLVLERAGREPRFSPSGRYLTARGGSGRLEVVDLLIQQVVFTTTAALEGNFGGVEAVAWMNGDAVLILGYGRKGAVGVTLPLVNERDLFWGEGCNGCHGLGSTSIWLDWDQIAFSASADDFSLLEAADSESTVKFWDEQKPEERGPPPKRPTYSIPHIEEVSFLADELAVPKTRSREEFSWNFSDKITFVLSNADADAAYKLGKLVADRMQKPNREVGSRPESKVATRGKISKRMVELDGKRVSPRNNLERLAEALVPFKIRIDDKLPKEPSRPIVRTLNNDNAVQASAVAVVKSAMLALAHNRPPLQFRAEASKRTKQSVYFAKSYGMDLDACTHDEGPEDEDQTSARENASAAPETKEENTEEENPPVISADQLVALWKFELTSGVLVVAQQHTQCGTSPDRYGDLIAVFSPADSSLPLRHTRIVAAYSDAGDPSDPAGIDKLRASSGSALRLDFRPVLELNLVDQRWLIVTSKDAATSVVFEVPSFKQTSIVSGLENPLDISIVSTTADHRNLVQLNESGSVGFYDLKTGQLRLRGKFVDDEIVLLDSALNFEATPEGASYLYVQVPGNPQLFSLDQFSSKLQSPGIGQRRVYQDEPLPTPPTGIAPPSIQVDRAGTSFVVTATSENGLSELRVMVDGYSAETFKFEGAAGRQVLSSDSFGPARWVSFYVTDVQGIKSVTKSFLLSAKSYSGTLRVLSVGINKFNGGAYQGKIVSDLAFAAGDAKRFEVGAKAYLSPSYSRYSSQVFAGEGGSRDKLLEALSSFAKATKRGDTLVLFLASHGLTSGGEFSLLLPSQSKGADIVELPFSAVSDIVKTSQGRVFIFLDACHSADAAQDAASEQLAATHQNVTVISASKGRQSSLESQSWGGGIFTTALLDVLKAAKFSGNHDLSMESLYANVRRIVTARTNGRQTPWFRRASWQGEQSVD